jgi:type VI secretion system FHA domain protein
VILTLEIAPPHGPKLGSASRRIFRTDGGTIGRASDSDWVLPHTKVSGRHALISYRDGVFYIEDRSKNGVYVNSAANRLAPGRPHPLKSGDLLLIDPYEIHVSIASEVHDDARRPPIAATPNRSSSRANPFDLDDPFEPAPFSSPAPPYPPASTLDDLNEAPASQELDPLKLLGGEPKREPVRKAPSARDLERSSPLDIHFQPPAAMSPPGVTPRVEAPMIPDDYDPLAPDDPPSGSKHRAWEPPRVEAPRVEPPRARAEPEPAPAPVPPPAPPPPPAPVQLTPPVPVPRTPPLLAPPPVAAAMPSPPAPAPLPDAPAPVAAAQEVPLSDLAAVLVGAGLDRAQVTPELANSFGRILRVVVSGVMDILRARQQIKDEFRMRMTHFRPSDNNPLKFSANVDDALHNLLIKRNAAYLGPVEAFEDAFDDLRGHQMAMLAGMRVAFEFMLAEFDPERLQEQFDRQLKKSAALLSVPAKMRYWDLYRERRAEMVKDPEESFRELFGEEFARAYEEQLKRLKAQKQDDKP